MRAILIILALVAVGAVAWTLTRDAGDTTVESATGEAETAAEAAGEAAEEAVEDVGDAANAAGDAAVGAADAVTDAADDAADATDEAADTASDATASAESSITAGSEELEAALSAETFDAASIRAAIQSSELSEQEKQAAEALVTQAEQNPDTVQSVVDQLRTLLDL